MGIGCSEMSKNGLETENGISEISKNKVGDGKWHLGDVEKRN
jgi:hypothetical protein